MSLQHFSNTNDHAISCDLTIRTMWSDVLSTMDEVVYTFSCREVMDEIGFGKYTLDESRNEVNYAICLLSSHLSVKLAYIASWLLHISSASVQEDRIHGHLKGGEHDIILERDIEHLRVPCNHTFLQVSPKRITAVAEKVDNLCSRFIRLYDGYYSMTRYIESEDIDENVNCINTGSRAEILIFPLGERNELCSS